MENTDVCHGFNSHTEHFIHSVSGSYLMEAEVLSLSKNCFSILHFKMPDTIILLRLLYFLLKQHLDKTSISINTLMSDGFSSSKAGNQFVGLISKDLEM